MPSAAATASPPRLPILALFTANAISMTGNQLAMLAIPWFVLATTGSAVKTGLTAFFSILPVVLSAFFGGALVDRIGYKRTSIIADLASGIAVALIPLLYAAQLLEFWMLLAIVFLGALLDAPGTTAREALVPDLAQAAHMPLERASSLLQIVERGSRLLGAPLAGILVGTLGAQNVLWLDTATFGVSALLVAVAVPTLRVAPQEQPGSYPAQLREGLLFIRGDRLMLALV
ncbi:MAG TPA: MFS transporter, partial [Ardenticatenaceae bacterium]|nr:MFS transporter [Ardenticatenaceae bacterium]